MRKLTTEEGHLLRIFHLVVRLEQEPELAYKVREDPAGYLRKFGIPDETINELIGSPAEDVAVEGPACADGTCWHVPLVSSTCPATCLFTINSDTNPPQFPDPPILPPP